MSERIYNFKAICCEGIPELFLDKLVARKHFSQYGHITRFILRPRRLSCTVAFETEAQAERALMEGGVYNGHKFDIEYAEHETTNVQNTEDWINSEVQSELDAISNVWHTAPQLTSFPPKFVNSILKPPKSTSPNFAQVAANSASSSGNKVNNAAEQQQRNVNPALRQELVALMRRPAYTAEEKYRVLDARDKLIRITNARKARFIKEKATKGTCADMCPEKERQMREFQRQVASFEQSHSDDQRISHKRAIKEYSRSSADQEAPLAHELRSEKTLNMTMAYMMHNIMDLCDDSNISIGDWFHFVWDRTRSIRKEITQQELCSLNAVKLVEQCARFHIHCAARLVAEEPSVFDTKINAENLTKCLQTLKYMYHDLRLNNVACPSEPEFRSYVVLLNLRDANFLWEIKQLPVHIQKSNDIRRAILFYNALQDNNFVRFFNMIRQAETSYLSACILLGYFNRLRVRAMEVLIKSYKWSKNNAFLPLPLITRSLGFEDELAAQDFLEAHGLQCDGERVLLDRMTMPETEYKMERAIHLVESKRCVSVGECICGEPLPPSELFVRHVPCNSFDENGLLKPEAWQVEDEMLPNNNIEPPKKPEATVQQNIFGTMLQAPKVQIAMVPQSQSQSQPQPVPTQTLAQMQQSTMHNHQSTQPKLMSDNIFKIPQASPPISPKQQQQQQTKSAGGFSFVLPPPAAPAMTKLMRDEEEAKLKAAAEEARMRAEAAAKARAAEAAARAQAEAARAAAEARAAEERRRRQLRVALEKRSMELVDELVDVCVKHEVAFISTEVYSAELRREKSYHRMSNMIYKEIVEQLIESEVRQTHVELHFEQRLLKRCFGDWVHYTRKQQEERRLLESTPLWLTSTSRQEQIDQIALPEQMTAKNLTRRYRLGIACDFSALLQRLPSSTATHAKLNLWSLLALTLPVRHLGAQRYFKLLCTMPAEGEEMLGFKNLCDRWLNRTLLLRPEQQQRSPSSSKENGIGDEINERTANDDAYINDLSHNVALCVRKVCGTPPLNERGSPAKAEELANCDGIVFFLTPKDLKQTRERLRNVAGSGRRIVFLLYDGQHCEEATLVNQLDLHKFGFGAYKIYGCHTSKSDFNFAGLFQKAVKFLARKSLINDQDDADLEQQSLKVFANAQLGDEQWQRWLFSVTKNLSFREVCKKPDFVVDLFNEAASRLQKIASIDLRHAKRFPYELQRFVPQLSLDGPHRLEHFVLGWHTNAHQCQLVKFFECVKLPAMPAFNGDSASPNDLEQFERSIYLWLLDFSHTCLPQSVELATQTAFSAIQALVTQMNEPDAQALTPLERLHELNYLPILKCFAIERLYTAMRDKQHPSAIVYRRSQLSAYEQMPWWLDYAPVTEVTFDGDAFNANPDNPDNTDNAAGLNQATAEVISSQNPDEIKAIMAKASAFATKSQIRTGKRKADLTNHFDDLTRNLDESIRRFDNDIELNSPMDSNKNECDDDIFYNANGETAELRLGGSESTLSVTGADIGQSVVHKRVKHDTASKTNDTDSLKDTIGRARSLLARIDAQYDQRQRREIQENQSKF